MTRGPKGCYVYATDPELQEYLREAVGASPTTILPSRT